MLEGSEVRWFEAGFADVPFRQSTPRASPHPRAHSRAHSHNLRCASCSEPTKNVKIEPTRKDNGLKCPLFLRVPCIDVA